MSDETLLQRLRAAEPVLWTNPGYAPQTDPQAMADVMGAKAAWARFAPLMAELWPELAPSGVIRSTLTDIADLRPALGYDAPEYGTLLVKGDHALPVAGSVKARGGVFEVLSIAVSQARGAELLYDGEDIEKLAGDDARAFFGERRIAVGSTGNLGLSVGIAARALGYKATVHMSHDAKEWKVARLQSLGVEVVQHETDYSQAVAAAREIAARDPLTHFVDDEDSLLLFKGYSAAAAELKEQLAEQGISIGPDRPLILYLPCGIGGAPGGIAHGARGVFGPDVHPFFVEPVQAPSALVQMREGLGRETSVYELGLSNRTEADGMAVATMSQLVAERMQRRLAGVFTVGDDDLFRWLALAETKGLRLEPSAASGFGGPQMLMNTHEGRAFRAMHMPTVDPARAVHVIWTTGGAFVPEEQYQGFVAKGRALGPRFDLKGVSS
ncbi:D-serine ammonia-lyase (plasmid) [Salipiger sp. CCB-MM3]|uniref:D-serine ammonia-lyase n=1 Tax=Salipiger sp. CCB-MM3 TaxID=1792508 RepID=UPI00080ABF48|nr:D-serine ammonia-lyase [Salipiger sp. CCB-MM3]ANT63514.1 D-serine ammonia-lyase [Salipiger sp. CCB-MM3]